MSQTKTVRVVLIGGSGYAGFEVVRETAVLDVPVWCMRRESRIPG